MGRGVMRANGVPDGNATPNPNRTHADVGTLVGEAQFASDLRRYQQ